MNPFEKPDLYNADCMEAMKHFPNGFFDLAIVDPPYGDALQNYNDDGEKWNRFGERFERYAVNQKMNRTGATWAKKYGTRIVSWDTAPKKQYFDELFRVSQNQIIWGGNYFKLPPTRCFLIWRKLSISESFSMAMCEYAWTSFFGNAKLFECTPQSTANEQRFHPTQKPVKLYSWQLNLFAKPGMKILDTHAGSASSLIACQKAGLDAWGFEIEPFYYKKAKERLESEKAQVTMFELEKRCD